DGGSARRAARRGGWVAASLVAQTALVAGLLAVAPRRLAPPVEGPLVEVKLFRAAATPATPSVRAPPPPPAAAPVAKRSLPSPARRPTVARVVQPKEPPPAASTPDREPELPTSPPTSSAAAGEGVVGGVEGGDAASQGNGGADPIPTPARAEFDASMSRPVLVSGPKLEYTRAALEHAVDGEMVVKCVITVDGRVYDCRVLRTLPFMERAVVEALERRRYRPAERGGRPLEVAYTFRIKLGAN
ncbi:MAG: TonB family protein, partial [Anaeromyxobacteraceae bacterium]